MNFHNSLVVVVGRNTEHEESLKVIKGGRGVPATCHPSLTYRALPVVSIEFCWNVHVVLTWNINIKNTDDNISVETQNKMFRKRML